MVVILMAEMNKRSIISVFTGLSYMVWEAQEGRVDKMKQASFLNIVEENLVLFVRSSLSVASYTFSKKKKFNDEVTR